MVGITSYGAFVPWLRINRKTIASAMGWFGAMPSPGEKAVANYDEDSITMAVASGIDCLSDFRREEIGGLYFATTTSPYRERQDAGLISLALDLETAIRTADFTDSPKAGTTALLSGCDAVKSGAINNLLVCAADCRLGKAGGAQEQAFGDGAAAFLIGDKNVAASLEGSYSLSHDFMGHWRGENDKFDRTWEDRFIRDVGYTKFIPQAILGLVKKYNLNIKDFAKIVYPCLYAREYQSIAKAIGASPEQIQEEILSTVGDTGTAYPLMMLVAALESAKPGDKILVVSYGNGCDALFFQVTDNIEKIKNKRGLKKYLASKQELNNYEKYLAFRGILPVEKGIRGEEIAFTQLSTLWRERKSIMALCGAKCKRCGTPQYPYQRVCVNPDCGAIDEMEYYRFSDKTCKLFTYTGDHLAFSPNPPAIYGLLDFDGGGRNWSDITDCELESVKVGMPLEMTFRRKYLDEARGHSGYGWKATPRLA
ncbi:MAG: OB-fold domain-containing protein [Chloroflexota bacterium]|nr:OB-fold domain-containing protein [Chloroflexota bacterium]